jgi:two-component system, chemotaxis family, chemotaxis protein CheY
MKSLIVEDNFLNRLSLQQILTPYGETHVAVNGEEAVEAFTMALDDKKPYNLICLDIRLPEMDGQAALKEIRSIEAERNLHGLDGVKIIMTTALGDSMDIMEAFKNQCEAYLVKPFDEKKLINHLKNFGLID